MSQNSNTDAEDILAELDASLETSEKQTHDTNKSEILSQEPTTEEDLSKKESTESKQKTDDEPETRNVILIGKKPIMTYVNSTLTQLSSLSCVTITARGKSITTAVDVSQFILKRMNSVGYKISDVRISSDSLVSNDGKKRNVSSIEIDIMRT